MTKKTKTAEERAAAVAEIHAKARQNEVQALIEMIDHADQDWRLTWSKDGYAQQSGHTGKPYRNSNQLILTAAMIRHEFKDPRWLTSNQAKQKGYIIPKDANYQMISFTTHTAQVDKKDELGNLILGKDGKPEKETLFLKNPVFKYYYLVNGSQIEGMPAFEPPNYTPEELTAKQEKSYADAEKMIQGVAQDLGLRFKELPSLKAFFAPELTANGSKIGYKEGGFIVLPMREQFENLASFYAVAFHELAHSTMGREGMRTMDEVNKDNLLIFGTRPYAREELIAELTSLFLCQELGIDTENSDLNKQSWAYIKSWRKAGNLLDEDLGVALDDAKKATNMILKHLPRPEKALELENQKEIEARIDDKVAEVLEMNKSVEDTRTELEKLWNVTKDERYIPILKTRSALENIQENQRYLTEIENKEGKGFKVTVSQVADKDLYLVTRQRTDLENQPVLHYVGTYDKQRAMDYLTDPDVLPEHAIIKSQPFNNEMPLPILREVFLKAAKELRSDDMVVDLTYLDELNFNLQNLTLFETDQEELDPTIQKVVDHLQDVKEAANDLVSAFERQNIPETSSPYTVLHVEMSDLIRMRESVFDLADSLEDTSEAIYELGVTDKALSAPEFVEKYKDTGLNRFYSSSPSEFENEAGLNVVFYILMPDAMRGIGEKIAYEVIDPKGESQWFNTAAEVHQVLKGAQKPEQKAEMTYAERVFKETLQEGTFDPSENKIIHQERNARSTSEPEGRLWLSQQAVVSAINRTYDKVNGKTQHAIPEVEGSRYIDVKSIFPEYDMALILPDNSVLARKEAEYSTFTISNEKLLEAVNKAANESSDFYWSSVKEEVSKGDAFSISRYLTTISHDNSYEYADRDWRTDRAREMTRREEDKSLKLSVGSKITAKLDVEKKPLAVGELTKYFSENDISKARADDLTLAELSALGREEESMPVEFIVLPDQNVQLFNDKSMLWEGKPVYFPQLAENELKHRAKVASAKSPIEALRFRYEAAKEALDPSNEDVKAYLNQLIDQIPEALLKTDKVMTVFDRIAWDVSRKKNQLGEFDNAIHDVRTAAEARVKARPTLAEQAAERTKGFLLKEGRFTENAVLDVDMLNAIQDDDLRLAYGSRDNVTPLKMNQSGEYGKAYLFGDNSLLLLKSDGVKVFNESSVQNPDELRFDARTRKFDMGQILKSVSYQNGKWNNANFDYEPVGPSVSIEKGWATLDNFPQYALAQRKAQEELQKIEGAKGIYIQRYDNFGKPMEIMAIGKDVAQAKENAAARYGISVDEVNKQGQVEQIKHLDLNKVFIQELFVSQLDPKVLQRIVEADKKVSHYLDKMSIAETIAYMTKNGTYDPIRKVEGNFHPYGRDLQQILNIHAQINRETPRSAMANEAQKSFDGQIFQFVDFSELEYIPNDGLAAYRNNEAFEQKLTENEEKNVLQVLRVEFVKYRNQQKTPNGPENSQANKMR